MRRQDRLPARRPFTGAWIETPIVAERDSCRAWSPPHGGVDRNAAMQPAARSRGIGRPLTGAWIETRTTAPRDGAGRRRPFTGAWIETLTADVGRPCRASPLHGGVDRNICTAGRARDRAPVAPSRGRGSKPRRRSRRSPAARSPLHGGVDRNADSTLASQSEPQVAPSRGRGSKPLLQPHAALCTVVAPSRGRGSKLIKDNVKEQVRIEIHRTITRPSVTSGVT